MADPSFFELQRRGFESLMLNSRVASLETSGALMRRVEVPIATELLGQFEDFVPNSLKVRLETSAIAFALFFSFENMARQLVSERLAETRGVGWWTITGVVPNAVKTRVKSQMDAAGKKKWHDVTAALEIDFTLFGDLYAIIDQNWADFKDLFLDLGWVKTRMDELEMSRNAVMHGRTLPPSEIARIQQYFDDWIDQVG